MNLRDCLVHFTIAGGPKSEGQPGLIGHRILERGWGAFIDEEIMPLREIVGGVFLHDPFGMWHGTRAQGGEKHFDSIDWLHEKEPEHYHGLLAGLHRLVRVFDRVVAYCGEISTTVSPGGPNVAFAAKDGSLSPVATETHTKSVLSPHVKPSTLRTYLDWANRMTEPVLETGCDVCVGIGDDLPLESNPAMWIADISFERRRRGVIGVEPIPTAADEHLNNVNIFTATSDERLAAMERRNWEGFARPEHLRGERLLLWLKTTPTAEEVARRQKEGWIVTLRDRDVRRLADAAREPVTTWRR